MGLNLSGADLALLVERRILTYSDAKEIISKGLNPGGFLNLESVPARFQIEATEPKERPSQIKDSQLVNPAGGSYTHYHLTGDGCTQVGWDIPVN